jgi:hypothetical protein
MIDFSGFKEFERTSRESFIQLWQHAHRIKGNIEISFQDPESGEDIYLVNDNGKNELYGFPAFSPNQGAFPCQMTMKFRVGEHTYELNAMPFFEELAARFPGAALEDQVGEA